MPKSKLSAMVADTIQKGEVVMDMAKVIQVVYVINITDMVEREGALLLRDVTAKINEIINRGYKMNASIPLGSVSIGDVPNGGIRMLYVFTLE